MQGYLFKEKNLFVARKPRWTGAYLYNLGRHQYKITRYRCEDCSGQRQWWSSRWMWPFGTQRVLGPFKTQKEVVEAIDQKYGRPELTLVR